MLQRWPLAHPLISVALFPDWLHTPFSFPPGYVPGSPDSTPPCTPSCMSCTKYSIHLPASGLCRIHRLEVELCTVGKSCPRRSLRVDGNANRDLVNCTGQLGRNLDWHRNTRGPCRSRLCCDRWRENVEAARHEVVGVERTESRAR